MLARSFELQEASYGEVSISISCVLSCKTSYEKYTGSLICPMSQDSMLPIILTAARGSSICAKIMKFLMILFNIGIESSFGLIGKV